MVPRFCDAHYWIEGQPCPICEYVKVQSELATLRATVKTINDEAKVLIKEDACRNCHNDIARLIRTKLAALVAEPGVEDIAAINAALGTPGKEA